METTERKVVARRVTPPLSSGVRLPERMTSSQVAQVAGVTPQAVRMWRDRGLIVPIEEFRCNGRRISIYRGADVEAMLSVTVRLRGERRELPKKKTRIYETTPLAERL